MTPPSSWSTAAFGDAAETSPTELSALGAHLNLCKGPHRGLVALQCAALQMQGFVASRFVTTLVIAALLMGLTSLVL